MYKWLRLYTKLYIKKQRMFLLRFAMTIYIHLYFSNQIEFDLKSIDQEFLLFRKSLNKQSIQYSINE